ncbi:endosialidase [Clostridiales bacterium COT073_COT-073]|nr:endosialidase [Clostridiales bacterium COT073_COT-073]
MKLEKLISSSEKGLLSFGDYESVDKQKQEGFELAGNLYNVKSHNEITRLEKNSYLLYESVPGTIVTDFHADPHELAFTVHGNEPVQVTLGLEPDAEYRLLINSTQVGKVNANRSGKISFSLNFDSGKQTIRMEKL